MHPDRVYHVEHVVMIDGAKLYAVTDLIFNGEYPIAVLIWGGKPGKEYPLVSVPLDPAHLSEHRDGQITHRYERPIEWPRRQRPMPHPALSLIQVGGFLSACTATL